MTAPDASDEASTAYLSPIRVGFALRKEKARKHVRAELIEAAQARGIEIIVIDEHKPLESQGPFDVILQKIRRKEFERELEAYKERHPEVHLCDPPTATLLLRNRKSMLDVVPRDGFQFESDGYRCTVPNHVVLDEGISFTEAQDRIKEAGLSYPFLAKSLWADGRAGSHDIAVIWSISGLQKLCQCETDDGGHGKLPVLLEQYVDHGECLFKVYVLGNQQVICTRPSLHLDLDTTGGDALGTSSTSLTSSTSSAPRDSLETLNRVSAYPASQSWGNASLAPPNHGVQTPPEHVWRGVARKLQERTGLSLFNFDLIVPREASDNLIMLIDVNYYPGIEKLPDSSGVLISFIESLVGTRTL